jgi:hypothetical protein
MAAMSDIPDPRPSATPPATFLNFLSGLSAQVLMQFGEIPNPLTGTRTANIDYARYTVQLLEVLNEKTTGNRSREEEEYLQAMLTDFRRRLALAQPPAG